jgi:RND superfamily putative drug exporter
VFVGTGIPIIKEIGLGASVAIAIDSTLIRLVLVPATMALLGDLSWWLPRPLRAFSGVAPRTVESKSVAT